MKKKNNSGKFVALLIAAAGLSFLFIKSASASTDAASALPDFIADFFNTDPDVTASGGLGDSAVGDVFPPDGWVEYIQPNGLRGIFNKRYYDDNNLEYPAGQIIG